MKHHSGRRKRNHNGPPPHLSAELHKTGCFVAVQTLKKPPRRGGYEFGGGTQQNKNFVELRGGERVKIYRYWFLHSIRPYFCYTCKFSRF